MALYTITEPHPTVPQNSYTHSGRGGAGNFFRAPATTSPAGVPTPAPIASTSSSSSSSRFYSGRGGAGNARSASERPVLSFDEEFVRAEARDRSAPAGYVGRGGAGNIVAGAAGDKSVKKGGDGEKERRNSSGSVGGESQASSASSGSFWGRLVSR
ncbi:hypothetical protein MMYC01_202237 [Madurella mycetomatis]|uniref:Uncharacterized protein n=1 Tax=Madurella mycetomatis TaxID=100816 RepID=A0A175WAJ6_9PEZI|nr:hypothetical protein MMYC01_202237 [Madurella mycetomatis]